MRLPKRFFGALPLEQGGDGRESQNDERNAGNRQRQTSLIETCVYLGLVNRVVSGKNGRSHPCVVHTGNGHAHYDRGTELLSKISSSEC